jgi:hypothetical protein
MSYKIKYTNSSGQKVTKTYEGSVAGAKGWAEALSKDNGGRRSECVHVADGPYDHSGKVTHIVTVGDR